MVVQVNAMKNKFHVKMRSVHIMSVALIALGIAATFCALIVPVNEYKAQGLYASVDCDGPGIVQLLSATAAVLIIVGSVSFLKISGDKQYKIFVSVLVGLVLVNSIRFHQAYSEGHQRYNVESCND